MRLLWKHSLEQHLSLLCQAEDLSACSTHLFVEADVKLQSIDRIEGGSVQTEEYWDWPGNWSMSLSYSRPICIVLYGKLRAINAKWVMFSFPQVWFKSKFWLNTLPILFPWYLVAKDIILKSKIINWWKFNNSPLSRFRCRIYTTAHLKFENIAKKYHIQHKGL